MRLFFDSSAFAKRFIEEAGSQKIEELCQKASEVGLSVICFPEIISALNRRLRERNINKTEYALAKERLSEELLDIKVINLNPKIIETSAFHASSNTTFQLSFPNPCRPQGTNAVPHTGHVHCAFHR